MKLSGPLQKISCQKRTHYKSPVRWESLIISEAFKPRHPKLKRTISPPPCYAKHIDQILSCRVPTPIIKKTLSTYHHSWFRENGKLPPSSKCTVLKVRKAFLASSFQKLSISSSCVHIWWNCIHNVYLCVLILSILKVLFWVELMNLMTHHKSSEMPKAWK